MTTITGQPEIIGFLNGKPVARLDLRVSTADDLPKAGDEVEGYIVAAPTNAQIIQLGKIGTLDEDGKWYTFGTGDEIVATGGGSE